MTSQPGGARPPSVISFIFTATNRNMPQFTTITCIIVQVFREVRRVLRPDGTLWLNMGDSYASQGGPQIDGTKQTAGSQQGAWNGLSRKPTNGLKPKDLMMMPARVAIALCSDGWYLRSDIVWSKPTAMPESVTDRPTKSHEYLFLLAKGERYYYDADAIREPLKPKTFTTYGTKHRPQGNDSLGLVKSDNWGSTVVERQPKLTADGEIAGANKRTIWTVASQPYDGAHFATFPPKLIEPCLLAGTSPKACEQCGAPWIRETVQNTSVKMSGPVHPKIIAAHELLKPLGQTSAFRSGQVTTRQTTGWKPTCKCTNNTGDGKCIVLDPFAGAGTTLMVASQYKRDWLGIELNAEYITLAMKRIEIVQPVLWTEVDGGVA